MNERAAPRYRRIADALRDAIVSGRLRPGDLLPTEMELCARHSVSRHTAREALRVLAEDRLIERRQGAGSVVADTPAPAFAQPTGDFDSILQYARDATFALAASGNAGEERLAALGLNGAYRWFSGLRGAAGQPPVALTTIYVRAALAPPEAVLDGLQESLSEWLERTHGVRIDAVEQRMEAVALDAGQAAALGMDAGAPALRTVRRYRDTGDGVVLLSESLHPAGRFAYTICMQRRR